MAKTSTLGSPGVEVLEIDNSTRLSTSTACTAYLTGFAPQGPVEEVNRVSTMTDFVSLYGEPTNAAERYFYYQAEAFLNGTGAGATLLTSRLPYGEGKGDTVSTAYTVMAYPAIPVIRNPKNQHASTGLSFDGIAAKYLFTLKREADGVQLFPSDCSSFINVEDENNTFSIKGLEIVTDEETKTRFISLSYTYDGSDLATTYSNSSYGIQGDNSLSVTFTITDGDPQGESVVGSISFDVNYEKGQGVSAKRLINQLLSEDGTVTIGFLGKGDKKETTFDTQKVLTAKIKGKGSNASRLWVAEDGTEYTDEELATTLKLGQSSDGETVTYESKNIDKVATKKTSYVKGELIDSNGTVYTEAGVYKPESPAVADGQRFTYVVTTTVKFDYPNTDTIKFDTTVLQENPFVVAKTYTGVYSENDQSPVAGNTLDPDLYDYTIDEETQTYKKIVAKDVTYLLGAPVCYHISAEEYNKLICGESLVWENTPSDLTPENFAKYENINKAALLVFNTARSIINENFEGFYIGVTDNMFVNPTEDNDLLPYNAVESVKITTDTYDALKDGGMFDTYEETGNYSTLNATRLGFNCDGNLPGSISRILERSMTTMDISGTDYDDTLSIGLFKLNKSTTDAQTLKLSYTLRERFNGAFGRKRLKSSAQATTPISYFIEKVVGDDSNNLAVMVNPYISTKVQVDLDGRLRGKVRVFGSKLEDNLAHYENKYKTTNAKAYSLLINQAGVNIDFLETVLKNEIADEELASQYAMFQKLDSLYPIGVYTTLSNATKVIGNVPYKLKRALELVENDEEYTDLDLVIDAGLSTIYPYSRGYKTIGDNTADTVFEDEVKAEGSTSETVFTDSAIFQGVEDLRTGTSAYGDRAQEILEDYLSVQNTFLSFCNSMANGGRGDSFFLGDVLRGVLIKGKTTKVQGIFGQTINNSSYSDGAVKHNWSTSIYYPIKHLTDSIVSTYASLYAQWFKVDDTFSGQKCWIPSSAYVAAKMASTDLTYGPWYAAAGLNRGVINGPIDYALNPTQTQRTDLYKICINSIPKLPNDGITIWGIRTMSKKDSAFDQNTCRRTFLYMEKKLKQFLRYYVFEPNTSYTRLNVYNDIQPFLESVKSAGGIYSYTCTCDATNNTPDIINNGDMAVDVAAAPTRTAENIILTMTCNKYTGDTVVS